MLAVCYCLILGRFVLNEQCSEIHPVSSASTSREEGELEDGWQDIDDTMEGGWRFEEADATDEDHA